MEAKTFLQQEKEEWWEIIVLEEWKEFVENRTDELKNISIEEFIEQWMKHPKLESFINWTDEYGWTMLHSAMDCGRLDVAKVLMENGADITIADVYGKTALMYASPEGYTKMVEEDSEIIPPEESYKALIENSRNDEMQNVHIETFYKHWMEHPEKERFINWKDEYGWTMLNCAIYYGRFDIAKLLLEHDADFTIVDEHGATALLNASFKGYIDIVRLLLEKGADLTNADFGGYTALMHACLGGHDDVVELLVEKGADIHFANDIVGMTALMYASWKGESKIVRLLVEKGAEINGADKKGMVALIWAASEGHYDTVKLLVDSGADTTITNKDGMTALMAASCRGHTKIVKLLVDKGVDVANANENGVTALMLACSFGRTDIVKLLLNKGVDVDKNRRDNKGHTALFYAAERGFADVVELLMMHKADSGKTDRRRLKQKTGSLGEAYSFYKVKDGRTPLFVAAQNGHHAVVAALLHYGADPYLCNNKSRIPRDVSVSYRAIQQLFRIHDYFEKREKGDAYNEKYITCGKESWNCRGLKQPVPPLEDIIHDIAKYPHFANKFLELYQENRDIISWLNKDGRKVQHVACKKCREAILFMGRYRLGDRPKYESPTCTIYAALDYGGPDEPNLKRPRRVAMKFFEEEEHFNNEMRSRRNEDGSPRFSSEFVSPDLAAYRADQNPKYAKACESWKRASGVVLSKYCFVMTLAERSLFESMTAENLSAKHKDLERRAILLNLSNVFSYLHGMGYVHGDIKPHNVVRDMVGGNVRWKAIDFAACTKIGDAVGLKLTTGSAPPEMLKVTQKKKAGGTESMAEKSKVILRQPGGGLDESELVKADPSFDVWSYGILMYQLVTGRSFFHCDLQGYVDDAGLQELANLTQSDIHEKLTSVADVNARVLLSKILRLDPKERPSMSEIGRSYYFHPSESPQGGKAESFGKPVFSIFVPEVDDITVKNLDHTSSEEKPSSALEANIINESTGAAKDHSAVKNLQDTSKEKPSASTLEALTERLKVEDSERLLLLSSKVVVCNSDAVFLRSQSSYWSEERYDLNGKSVEFAVSFQGRGMAIAGIGTRKCLHDSMESNDGAGGGVRCSLHVGRFKFVVRRSGVEEVFREKKLADQERAMISFKMNDGVLSVSFVGSSERGEEIESAKVSMPSDQRYYLYMRAPPGFLDVKFHDVNIRSVVGEKLAMEKAKLADSYTTTNSRTLQFKLRPRTEMETGGEREGIEMPEPGAVVQRQDSREVVEEVDSDVQWV